MFLKYLSVVGEAIKSVQEIDEWEMARDVVCVTLLRIFKK